MQLVKPSGFWLFTLFASFIAFGVHQAKAETFPQKTVHIVVGLAPGGGTDTIARVLAQQLSKIWSQPVIVENRLGAAGATANQFVAKSTPDGYTLLFTSDDITALTAFRSDLPYNLLRDLTPVSLVAATTPVLTVNPSLPVHNVKDLIALARSEPGKLTYATGGVGSVLHLQTMLFASMAHINVVHVPYKGSMAGLIGVAGGEVDFSFAPPISAQALTKAGKLRMIASTGATRSPLLPSLPTVDESGVPGFAFTAWFGVFAPAGLPQDVLAALNTAVGKAANSPEMKAILTKQGAQTQTDSPAQFASFVDGDVEELVKIVKSAGLKPH